MVSVQQEEKNKHVNTRVPIWKTRPENFWYENMYHYTPTNHVVEPWIDGCLILFAFFSSM